MTKSPKQIIEDTLTKAGYPLETVRYWVCVSAFETAGWTSSIFRLYKNLWGMTLAPRDTTAIGASDTPEKQAIYTSVQSSADDLILFMQKRWKYPKSFASIEHLVSYMKDRNYFMGNKDQYIAGVKSWYKKFYA
jgi:hypothetical protein